MARGFQVFQNFESEKYVHLDDLKRLANYICRNLNSDGCLNYKYWYHMYLYSSKAYIVCKWRQSKGLQPVAKCRKAICENNLVNVFKEHKDCRKGCGSVYYKYICFLYL